MLVGCDRVANAVWQGPELLPFNLKLDATRTEARTMRCNFLRHKISFPVELRDERVNTPLRVNATDISGNGCYVETVMPLPVATALRVDLWIDQERLTTSAVVRTRDPGVGMGIEFTGMTEETKKRFQAHLDKMDPVAFSHKEGR